jgi:alkylresorcinol/alkylpyrone synthase
VTQRALFVPPDWWQTPRTLDDANAAWKAGALAIAGAAVRDALALAHKAPGDVGLIAVTSVTGYATPGLDLLLVAQEGLSNRIARAHFNCIGCHAAVPLLKVAADHAALRPGSVALSIAVEICSACFRPDPDPQNLVALALFADGAAAAVVSTEGDGPAIIDFGAAYDLDNLDKLGFTLTTGGFRIVLDPTIPAHIGGQIDRTVRELLDRNGVRMDQVSTWCFHPGGSRILDEVQRALALDDDAMRASRRVLRGYGNMSSPSVMFVLAEAMNHRRPPDGTYGVLAAFGPGLGIETCLLRFG